jgi:hypothetical protein
MICTRSKLNKEFTLLYFYFITIVSRRTQLSFEYEKKEIYSYHQFCLSSAQILRLSEKVKWT